MSATAWDQPASTFCLCRVVRRRKILYTLSRSSPCSDSSLSRTHAPGAKSRIAQIVRLDTLIGGMAPPTA